MASLLRWLEGRCERSTCSGHTVNYQGTMASRELTLREIGWDNVLRAAIKSWPAPPTIWQNHGASNLAGLICRLNSGSASPRPS